MGIKQEYNQCPQCAGPVSSEDVNNYDRLVRCDWCPWYELQVNVRGEWFR